MTGSVGIAVLQCISIVETTKLCVGARCRSGNDRGILSRVFRLSRGSKPKFESNRIWDIKKKVSFMTTPILDTQSVLFDANLVDAHSHSQECDLFN